MNAGRGNGLMTKCNSVPDADRPPASQRMLKGLAILWLSGLTGCVTLGEPVGSCADGQCSTCAAPTVCATCGVVHSDSPLQVPPSDDAAWNSTQPYAQTAPPACSPLEGAAPTTPDLEVARATRECESRIAELQTRIDALSDENREGNLVRDQQMKKFFGELQALNDEVSFWKAEVQRLDAEAQEQHERDMQSLDALIELVGQIPVAGSRGQSIPSSASSRN